MNACAITGHRPTRFKWKYKENYSGCKRLKKRLGEQFEGLYREGVRHFYVGGALGVDLWAGEVLLRLKEQPGFEELELFIVLPFAGHDKLWDERSCQRMAFLIRHSAQTVTLGQSGENAAALYKRRNEYMVDHADILLAVYDNDKAIRSGTGQTVHYAQRKGLPVILIHPDTAAVSKA